MEPVVPIGMVKGGQSGGYSVGLVKSSIAGKCGSLRSGWEDMYPLGLFKAMILAQMVLFLKLYHNF